MRHTATHQGVPLVVRGVVISKVGDDLVSVADTARRFLDNRIRCTDLGRPHAAAMSGTPALPGPARISSPPRRQADAFMGLSVKKTWRWDAQNTKAEAPAGRPDQAGWLSGGGRSGAC